MYENAREQWPVSVRLEDFESGAFELPAGGLFVVRDDYVVPASMVSLSHPAPGRRSEVYLRNNADREEASADMLRRVGGTATCCHRELNISGRHR